MRNDISGQYYKSQFTEQMGNRLQALLLLKCHPFFTKISIAVNSIARQAVDIVSLSSSFCSSIHVLARYVALKRIGKQVCFWDLWKTISFLLSQIGQQRAHKPAKTFFFCAHCIPFNQNPNIWTMLGLCRPNVMWIIRQSNLATWQSKNRCAIVSLLEQKQHCWVPCQFRLAIFR